MIQCPNCNARLDDDAVFCGNCGKQVAPLQARGATVGYNKEAGMNDGATIQSIENLPRPGPNVQATKARNYAAAPDTPQAGTLYSPPPANSRRVPTARIAVIAALVILVIAGGTIAAVALLKNNSPAKSNGRNNTTTLAATALGVVNFSDDQNGSGHSNVVNISVNNLSAPPAGSQYDAWLVNTVSEQTIGLGALTLKSGSYTLKFADGNTNLLGAGDKLEVTLENGTANLPTGRILLSASFPPHAFVHIKHLLFSFPNTPGKIGLIVGVVDQAQQLSATAQLLESIAPSNQGWAIQCAAQSIVDIAEGAQGAHYQPLGSQCASQNITLVGDGYGLLGSNGYIANGEAHASLAATQSDSTDSIRVHARHVAICLENMKGWITTVEQDALALLNDPTNTTKVQEVVTLSNHTLNGVDTNGDGSIDPVPGEGGAATAYYHAQLMAALVLAPGS